MRMTKTISIPRIDYMKVSDLKKYLVNVPDNATISIQRQPGDYNQMDYYSADVYWMEEV